MPTEENKAAIRRLYEEVDKGNLTAMDELFTTDYVDHNPPPVSGLAPGLEGLKQTFTVFYNATRDGITLLMT
jgi:hypothetical protein